MFMYWIVCTFRVTNITGLGYRRLTRFMPHGWNVSTLIPSDVAGFVNAILFFSTGREVWLLGRPAKGRKVDPFSSNYLHVGEVILPALSVHPTSIRSRCMILSLRLYSQ